MTHSKNGILDWCSVEEAGKSILRAQKALPSCKMVVYNTSAIIQGTAASP
jgi:hypothetical protein